MKVYGNTVGTTMPRANWNQNDDTAADYVKGRTHYDASVTIEWDGDTTDLPFVSTLQAYFISDYVPSVDETTGEPIGIIGANIRKVVDGEETETTVDSVSMISGMVLWAAGNLVIATKAGTVSFGQGSVKIPTAGIYSTKPTGLTELEIYIPDIKKLDPKYIPDSVQPTFIVTITENGVDEDGNTTYSADKILSEIFAAIEAGKNVVALFNGYQYLINGYQQPHWIEFSYSDYVGYDGYLMNARFVINDEGVFYEYYEVDIPDVNVMEGATAEEDGSSGLVPAPSAGDNNKFLRGDGTWAEAGGSGSGDAIPTPSTAEVGQTIVVTEVDENGKPTAWEAADLGSYENKPFRLLNTVSVTADDGVSGVEITTDSDGNPFELDEAYVIVKSCTRYGGWAYSQISTNAGIIGEERISAPMVISIRKFLGMWKGWYHAGGYANTGTGGLWGLNHAGYMHNVADYPKITKIRLGFIACELEVWGR